MSAVTPFTVEDPATGDSFVVDGREGWLSFIAGYTKMPEPRREKHGWPVLEPSGPDDMSFLRTVLRPGILEDSRAENGHPGSQT